MVRLPPRSQRRNAKTPESKFSTLPNGLKYCDITVGIGPKAVKGSHVMVYYVAMWKGITFMASRLDFCSCADGFIRLSLVGYVVSELVDTNTILLLDANF